MATIKYSALVSDIRGKFNGSQLSRSRAGSLLQQKGNQRRFASAAQLSQRLKMASAGSFWRSLTPEQQEANNAAALNYPYIDKYGDTRYYTGYQLLLRSNLNIQKTGGTLISEVPATPPTVYNWSPFIDTLALDTGFGVFMYASTTTDAPESEKWQTLVYVSPAVSSGVSNYTGKWLYLCTWNFTTFPDYDDYIDQAIPGFVAVVGQRVFLRAISIDNTNGLVQSDTVISAIIEQGF